LALVSFTQIEISYHRKFAHSEACIFELVALTKCENICNKVKITVSVDCGCLSLGSCAKRAFQL